MIAARIAHPLVSGASRLAMAALLTGILGLTAGCSADGG